MAEQEGQTLRTRDHRVIRRWADERRAEPATVPGTEHDGELGVLRLDFPGVSEAPLRPVSWYEWFKTFDARSLEFVYQQQTRDGKLSNFFRLTSPEREDA